MSCYYLYQKSIRFQSRSSQSSALQSVPKYPYSHLFHDPVQHLRANIVLRSTFLANPGKMLPQGFRQEHIGIDTTARCLRKCRTPPASCRKLRAGNRDRSFLQTNGFQNCCDLFHTISSPHIVFHPPAPAIHWSRFPPALQSPDGKTSCPAPRRASA